MNYTDLEQNEIVRIICKLSTTKEHKLRVKFLREEGDDSLLSYKLI